MGRPGRILGISNGEGELSRTAASTLIAATAYPTAAQKREQLQAALVARWVLHREDREDLALIAEEVLPILLEAPDARTIQQRALRRFQSARLAAEAVTLFIRATVNHPELRLSFTKIVDLLEILAENPESTTWQVHQVTSRGIWKSWNAFRSVVHLHYLGQLLPWLDLPLGTNLIPRAESKEIACDRLLQHLSVAEGVRELLEQQQVLKPGEAWRVPQDLPLPQLEIYVPPLDEADLEILGHYRQRR